MSAQPNDGGPAFPHPALANEGFCPSVDLGGMSLRDWFAGQALAAFIASSEMNGNDTAATAYAFADAMISERSK